MSFSYWVSKKFGVLIVLFYVAVMGVLVVSNYRARGIVTPDALASYFPAGRSYLRTTKNKLVREIFGLPAAEDDVRTERDTVDIVSYTDEGAVIRLNGGSQETVEAPKVVRYLTNRDSSELERAIQPLHGPLNVLLDLHLRFMKRVEDGVGGGESGSLRRLIIPKIVISVVYLGLVFMVLFFLRRYDRRSTDYKGGFADIYASFLYWPIAVIIVSVAGANVVDVVRHLPDSYHFMHWYIVGGWAAIFAWPLFVAALSVVDIVRSVMRLDISHALLHAAVLGAGIISIPLVTVGVMFAILVAALYIGYRFIRNTIGSKPSSGSGTGLVRRLLGR